MIDYIQRSNDRIELFFDRAAPGFNHRQKKGRLSVTYVPAPRTADQAIIGRLQKLGNKAADYTVVTSDHEIKANARSLRVKTMDSPAFVQKVLQTPRKIKNITDTGHPLGDEEVQWWLDVFKNKGKS